MCMCTHLQCMCSFIPTPAVCVTLIFINRLSILRHCIDLVISEVMITELHAVHHMYGFQALGHI